ncbi:MAG: hypothetical protein K6G30_01800 [Acetatifactor sp.]|nr:hypothetical protein [Acetatifactor sp.]
MDRKSMPLILMLVAGAVTCIITFIRKYSILGKLVSLFIVLLVFYFLGSVIKWTLDYFDNQNAKKNLEEGEVIEKEIDTSGGTVQTDKVDKVTEE